MYLEFNHFYNPYFSAILAQEIFNKQLSSDYLPLQYNYKIAHHIINNKTIIRDDLVSRFIDYNLAELTIVLFHLIIYSYPNTRSLQEVLSQFTHLNEDDLNLLKKTAIIIYLIIDRQRNLIEGLKSYLIIENEKEIEDIKWILNMIKERKSLLSVEKEITKKREMTIALYQTLSNFFTINENWEISILRSNQFQKYQKETYILTSLLLGLKNQSINIQYQQKKQLFISLSEIEKISIKLQEKWQGKQF